MQKHILLIEDEKKVSKFIKLGLEDENFLIDTALDGEVGLSKSMEGKYDLIILDIMLPKIDGFEILKALRIKKINTPVIILTAKDSLTDKVEGLNIGADDYLTKPFAFAELFARVKSLLRRGDTKSTQIQIDDLVLDTVKHSAKRRDTDIELTAREYALLEFLMKNRNKVVTRKTISEKIWNYDFDTGTNVIDVYVNHLRQKVDGNFEKKLIQTVRGVGYIIKEE
jgi:DNA-binding response OmpR family regulator